MPIKTNQLKIDLNVDAVSEKYDVFKIETSEKHFNHGAYILDAPLLCNNVCSVFFESGKCFYVLMRKDFANKSRLKEILLKTEGGESITIVELYNASIDQRVMVSLLLNALASYDLDFLRFNNLTGHLYCFHPKWIRKRSDKNESTVLKVPCIEIAVTKDLRLTIAVRTFTSELLKSKIVFKKRKFEQYPKYMLAANNTLRRKLNTDTGKCFILRQTEGDRTEIPFMDIQNLERFEASKMGVLQCMLHCFNDKYQGICNLQFQTIDEYIAIDECSFNDRPKSLVKENKRVVQQLLSKRKIKIVDYIGDDYSARFCEDIRSILNEKYGIDALIGKRAAKDHLNLCVIHNAEYYDGKNDPHEKPHEGIAVQHITLEDFMGSASAAISTVIHEVLIKHDIERKQISLFDWNQLGVNEEISFGMRASIDEEEKYFFMKIHPDGSFDFEEQEFDLFTFNDYTDCVNIFTDFKDVAGVICYENGDINIIRDTSWFTIPEIEKLHEELSAGNTYLRGREKRQELLSSITDIKLFDQGNCKYYFAGIIGAGMQAKVNDAANIRCIEVYRNSALRFNELLPLMNVTFVRNGQLTVLPFPFKYLREYIQLIQ